MLKVCEAFTTFTTRQGERVKKKTILDLSFESIKGIAKPLHSICRLYL